MMLKGAQRGNAKKLALHLLNEDDNDLVEVHEVSGFVSEDVTGAFKEIQAIAKGTKCRQPFFSVSMNPPANVSVTVEMIEEAADRIAEVNGLVGQPRVLVFHEKDGRRHAHLVISRIDAQTMTAKNLPHFKNRLMALSRDLFFEHQWKMPAGLRDRSLKSPTNVTLAEWQAAKRRGKNAIDQKKLIQQCWMVSDGRSGFEAALQDHGYILAKGDRRGHVVVCHDGEVLAVARAIGKRAKAVRERLGEADGLPSVDDAMAQHRNKLRRQFVRMAGEARNDLAVERAALENERKRLITAHRSERTMLDDGQARHGMQKPRDAPIV
ncbi:relaxase/mobilization nuclease domain-containing protein [Roseibium album]|uniref:relaxase/mobilization nuclease domain-containing protein n=1 Tax=Roseibium album TaxID=311410 RepID=UPI003298DF06